ncbi:glycosyltransferase, partial [Planctopirus hydrillae]|uniref:glycosyltransferase n=1 Tax=Planctopirus hydrillae TaxID=1841610 RepID=UPI0010421498
MRFSICIAAHNEAHLLSRTLHAVRTSLLATSLSSPAIPGDHPRCEIIVVDDASTDGSIAAALADFPNSAEFPLRVERFETRQGASPAKHRAAELARGAVLVFLDAHVLPEPGSLERLVAGVEASQGRDLLTPALPALDESTFTVIPGRTGLGYGLDLADLSCRWLPLSNLQLDEETRLYHQPALIGCVLAVSRETYFALGG